MPFDHFNLIAGLYNCTAQFNPPALLLDLLALPPSGLLLDAGGGTGHVAKALHSRVREVVVADISRGMLRHAVDKGLTTACAPAEYLPFVTGAFDRIIMVDALHHVFDQRQTITELWRVLAPGGRVVIIEPDIRRFSIKLVALVEKLLLMRSHFLDGEQIANLFRNCDVQVRIIQNELNILILVEKSSQI